MAFLLQPLKSTVAGVTNTTASGAVQVLQAVRAGRTYISIQNTSDTAMWLNFGTTDAAANVGFRIDAGGTWTNPAHFCPTSRITVFGTNTKTYAHLIV